MPSKKNLKLKDLLPDKRNVNRHSEYGMSLLEASLEQNGFGRSILLSADNEIIAGNGVTEIAGSKGMENVEVIDTDGTKIIALRRTDIKSGTAKFYNMALADNIVSKANIVLDANVAEAIVTDYKDTGEWVERITHTKRGKADPNQLNHDKKYCITLDFTNESDFIAVKDKITTSGLTAEQFILKMLKIHK